MKHNYDSADELAGQTLLSEQEAEVAYLVLQGLSNGEIADELGIAKKQVEMYRYQRIRPKIRKADEVIEQAKATSNSPIGCELPL